MSSAEKAVQDYKCTLKDLTNNNKLKINVLTILAEDYSRFSSEIVDCIEEATFEAPDNMKLVHLYLIDSISKNVDKVGDYPLNFSRNIVKLFTHVFQKSDDKTRASLYKLRNTWQNVFPRGKLYMLDVEVHSIDPNWPVHSPKNGQAVVRPVLSQVEPVVPPTTRVHVNPKFVNRANNNVPPLRPLDRDVNPVSPLQRPQPTTSSSSITSKSDSDSPLKAPVTMGSTLKTLNKKKEVAKPQNADPRSSRPEDKKNDQTKTLKKISELGPIPKKKVQVKEEPQDVGPSQESTERIRKIKKEVTKRRDPPVSSEIPEKKKPRVGESWKTDKKPVQRGGGSVHRPSAVPSPPMMNLMNGPVVPTVALGSHAFNIAPQPSPLLPQGPVPSFSTPPLSSKFPLPGVRAPFPPMNPTSFTATAPVSHFNTPVYNGPPTLSVGPPTHIKNDTPKLPNVPGNNRIFVDGKAYEVLYLGDVAVIERNGVPHRISFCGLPRDVIIDGVAHRMAFGDTKQVEIDGHTHFLRFGAPSRELYMGDFAFKGAFGGPPIMATINGKRHEIRMMGPPPEVKIEQDPCYELIKELQSLRQQDGKTKEDKKDLSITELLSKLQRSGVLTQISEPKSIKSTPSPPIRPRKSPSPIVDEPIIPSTMKLDKSEELDAPLTSLSEFSLMKYKSVTRDLYDKKSACPDCGIGFEDMNSAEYRKHLDAHLQMDLNGSEGDSNLYSRTRTAFQSEEEFVIYSETEEVNRPSTANPLDSGLAMDSEDQTVDALSADTELRECSACREKFEEYFDNDSDEWRLRDCVLVQGNAYHRACKTEPVTAMETD